MPSVYLVPEQTVQKDIHGEVVFVAVGPEQQLVRIDGRSRHKPAGHTVHM